MPEERSISERLLNLVYALAQSKIGLTKNDILSIVEAYSSSKAGRESIERMFERDKEVLRRNGINIVVFEPIIDDGNNQESRYLISQDDVTFPASTTFDAKEMALLNLAASAWNNAGQSKMLGSALFKLKALGQDSEDNFLDVKPVIPVIGRNFFEIEAAIEENKEINFFYLKPGDATKSARTIWPESLVEFEYRWHVIGIDPASEKPKTFLLSRIIGDVKMTNKTFTPSIGDANKSAAEFALEHLEAFANKNIAKVFVLPNSRALGELKKLGLKISDPEAQQPSDSSNRYLAAELSFADLELFADELASFGPEVIVTAPDNLRDAVIDRHQMVIDLHQIDREVNSSGR